MMIGGLQNLFWDRANDQDHPDHDIHININHDPIEGERYCCVHLRLPIAWDARFPRLGKHHGLQQYCSRQTVKSEHYAACLFSFLHILQISSGPTLQTAKYCGHAVKPMPTERLSFSEFFQSAFTR